MNKIKIFTSILMLLILTSNLAIAMTVNSVDANNFSPGEEQEITLEIENTLDENVKDVSLELNTSDLPFTIISTEEIDGIDEDDSESLNIQIKAMSSAQAGDYSIKYKINYQLEKDIEEKKYSKEGSFVLTVEANPELTYTVTTEKPVVGTQGKIEFMIVNKGLGDAKFVSVKIIPQGYTLLSSSEEYIGTIGSDDFETVNLNVIFDGENPVLNANIEYKDFNNKKIVKNIILPVKVYTNEEALKLGLIKQDNTLWYVLFSVLGVVSFFVIRKIRKKRKQNKSQGK